MAAGGDSDTVETDGAEAAEEDAVDWVAFSQAGYADEAYDPWADLAPPQDARLGLDDDDGEDPVEGGAGEDEHALAAWEIPPAPSPAGVAHLVRSGLCDWCLGRLGGRTTFDRLLSEVGSEVRASAVKHEPEHAALSERGEPCLLCEDLFAEADVLVERILDQLDGIELGTIQLGGLFPRDQLATDDEVRRSHGAPASAPLKPALLDEISRRLSERRPDLTLVREHPDALALLDVLTLQVDLDIRPLYLYGRYRKLSREIPQTRWPCRHCRGRRCERCDHTGLQYPTSVQDLVGEPLRAQMSAEDTAFHGMGREDIDVRCLGRGRPFVLELKRPSRRTTELDSMVETIAAGSDGRVEVEGLRWSTRSEVVRIKDTPAEKSYRITFECEAELEAELAEKSLRELAGMVIEQRTPRRVSHRRSDKVRKRVIVSVDDVEVVDGRIMMDLRTESGTYVKELVHGDEGRTTPSVAGLLGGPCGVVELDVLDVHAD